MIAKSRAELAELSAVLPSAKARSERTTVKAPVSGRVNRIFVSMGGTVAPSGPLLEFVPSEAGLLVEVAVSPKDISSVRVGQRVKVSLTAYEPSIYGTLDGEVTNISPDAIFNERTTESHFIIEVRTRASALRSQSGKRLPIGAGMVADVAFMGDRRSVLSYLLTPFTRLKDNAFRE